MYSTILEKYNNVKIFISQNINNNIFYEYIIILFLLPYYKLQHYDMPIN